MTQQELEVELSKLGFTTTFSSSLTTRMKTGEYDLYYENTLLGTSLCKGKDVIVMCRRADSDHNLVDILNGVKKVIRSERINKILENGGTGN